MARANRITVDVDMTISDETLRRCCRIIEMWMDDNPDRKLVVEKVATITGYQHRIHVEGPSGVLMEKLRDCPFCGGKAQRLVVPVPGLWKHMGCGRGGLMTYRARYIIEHPGDASDFISQHCPEPKENKCPFQYDPETSCYDCWNREAPPRKVKPRRKKKE